MKNKESHNEPRENFCFIKDVITRSSIIAGDYTYYYDDPEAELFENHVTHHDELLGDKLIIGKYCAIRKGVVFVMNGIYNSIESSSKPFMGDTIIGNDVRIGKNVTIMPGVHIGDGTIIGDDSVVINDIPPYRIAKGNPCTIVEERYNEEYIELLNKFQWWNWDEQKANNNYEILNSGNIELLKTIDE